MKIVNLISGKDLGGPKQTFLHYSDNLRQLGHQVTSVIRPKAQLEPLLKQRGLHYTCLAYPRTRLPLLKHMAVAKIRGLLLKESPDLVIVHKPVDAVLVRAAMPAHCKLVLILHSYTENGINAADLLVCVSPVLANFARTKGYNGALEVIPNLVEIATEEPSFKSLKKTPVIACMGILRRTKGQDILLQAAAILKRQGLEFELVIAGKGRWQRKIDQSIKDLGLRNISTRLDWISNQERDGFLDKADIVCLPSRGETFGMVVIEAMARKRLVVATKCGGPQGIIEDQVNGLLCDIDAQSLAEALAKALRLNEKSYQALCEAAYLTAKNTYSQAPVREQIKQLLTKL